MNQLTGTIDICHFQQKIESGVYCRAILRNFAIFREVTFCSFLYAHAVAFNYVSGICIYLTWRLAATVSTSANAVPGLTSNKLIDDYSESAPHDSQVGQVVDDVPFKGGDLKIWSVLEGGGASFITCMRIVRHRSLGFPRRPCEIKHDVKHLQLCYERSLACKDIVQFRLGYIIVQVEARVGRGL